MRVKICGITNAEDARAVVAAGADCVGLILAASRRQIRPATAAAISATLPATVPAVLVFRDAPLTEVLAAVELTGCTWVQLHGREPVDYLRRLRDARPGLRIIRAWEIAGPADGAALEAYLADAEADRSAPNVVLLDVPKGGPHPGYDVLGDASRRLARRPPEVWCAGSLTPDNLLQALAAGMYDGVDVASGVEAAAGRKDHAAVRRFIDVVRGLQGQAQPRSR